MFYKILIEPAKSDRSSCKNCSQYIEKNSLRVRVVDAREFNAFVKKHKKQNLSGEGLSRGYFECVGPKGQTIDIKKYFVHLDCYERIQPHPFERQYFDLKGFKSEHKKVFEDWLGEKNKSKKSQLKGKSQLNLKIKKSLKQKPLTKSSEKVKTKQITKKKSNNKKSKSKLKIK